MANYNPKNTTSREALALALRAMFARAKFTLRTNGKYEFIHEEVYSFKVDDDVTIFVYSTISQGRTRTVGSDAIRVFATKRQSGKEIGWVKTKRINRVGQIDAICDRTLKAMREAYKSARQRAA